MHVTHELNFEIIIERQRFLATLSVWHKINWSQTVRYMHDLHLFGTRASLLATPILRLVFVGMYSGFGSGLQVEDALIELAYTRAS